MPSWILAIDFGTSYTVAATRVGDRAPEIIDIEGERRTPSVVLVDRGGGVHVGRAAEDLAIAEPNKAIRALKNRLGDQAPVILDGRPFQVVMLVGALLRRVYDEAVMQMGQQPDGLHLTHPATWNRPHIDRLAEAATRAGLPTPVMLPEPVAAALTFATDVGVRQGKPLVIYDLGGGTFDCAVVSSGAAGFTVLGRPTGDSNIGGELFDELVVNHIGESLEPAAWEAIQVGESSLWRQVGAVLRNEARRAKEALSTHPSASVTVPLPDGLWHAQLTRAQLDELIRPYIAETITDLQRCIEHAGVPESELAGIALVGGSTRAPLVEDMVRAAFPSLAVGRRGDPKATVAAGATLAADTRLRPHDAALAAATTETQPDTARDQPRLTSDLPPPQPLSEAASNPPPPPLRPPAPPTVPATPSAPATPTPSPSRRPRRRPFVVAAALVALIGVASAIVLFSRRDGGDGAEGDGTTLAPDSTASASSSTSAVASTAAPIATTSMPPATSAAAPPIDFGGATVRVIGAETNEEALQAINTALGAFGESVGIEVTYEGASDLLSQITSQTADSPNIAVVPSGRTVADLARAGSIQPLPTDVVSSISEHVASDYLAGANVDGIQYGVPVRTDLKSLVWYQPSRFAAAGYEVPTTFDEFTALIDRIAADGGPKALCVGIENGASTGWVFTDWVEELVLRRYGTDVYDQWVSHAIPFNDPRIVDAMTTVLELWSPENVYTGAGGIAATSFGDTASLLNGDCLMHRQLSFFSVFFPQGTTFGDGGVDVFYLPDIRGDRPLLTQGQYATALDDDPATSAVLEYMATAEYAQARQSEQLSVMGGEYTGFTSAARGQDVSAYAPLERTVVEILTSGTPRNDASDAMPADIGSGAFFTFGTAAVRGEITAQEAADQIEAAWQAS